MSSTAFPEEAFNYDLLHRLTELAPGAIFQLKVKADGEMSFPFISRGIEDIHPGLNPASLRDNPRLGFSTMHPEDLPAARASMHASRSSLQIWNHEFRVIDGNGDTRWHKVLARPVPAGDGSVTWYGTFQDITENKEYIRVLEKILFDISHVIRKPVATIQGLSQLLSTSETANRDELLSMMKSAADELDTYIRQLNSEYDNLKNPERSKEE
jgi:PAS domain S-box-containing protein